MRNVVDPIVFWRGASFVSITSGLIAAFAFDYGIFGEITKGDLLLMN